ncbi:uncharacterized protein [Haliotis asinina]|uniref:uncharacterized protein n=1 Tax=Haliotis asinina TaxID=109174 RepID=UPI0035322197
MELSTVVFLSLVLCAMGDVHAGESLEILTTRVRVVEQDLNLWKFSSMKTETKLMNKIKVWKESLKEELTSTFLPSLIEPFVKQAITNILTEDDIGHPTNGKVLEEVHSVKDNVQYIKTRLRAITRDLRHVERERDTYRKSGRKERSVLTKDIRALQMQVNQAVVRATSYAKMLRSQLNQTIDDVLETNQTLAGLTQDFRTLNTSCVVTEREMKSYREGLQEMRRNVSTDIRSLNIQLNQSIGDLSDSNQTLSGLTQDFRTLNTSCVVTEREMKSYREGLQEMRRNVSTDIRSLNIQLNQAISNQFDTNQTLYGLTQDFRTLNTSFLGMRKEIKEFSPMTYHGTTEASTDPSPNNTFPPAPVTAQDLQASTTDACEYLTPSKTVPPAPVTTQDSDTHATPSAATGRDFYDASMRGDLERVKRILAEGDVDINYRGQNSRTPVMEAAWKGHRDVVEFLVGRGADVSLVDRYGDNVLHFACRDGDLETVKLIVSMNVVDINSRGWNSMTPVMRAAWRGHRDVVKFLVGRGADVSLVDGYGNNVLHFVCRDGDLETVKLIMSMNVVDINSRGWNSMTPVMWAAGKGHRDVVKFLVDRGADVSLVNGGGDNVLHFACRGGDLETVKLIMSMNVVDINSRGWNSRTPVLEAARYRHWDVVQFLVGGGADVSLVDSNGNNALHFACISGDLETVKLIVSMNVVDINVRNNDGQTAADYARGWRHQRVVDLLVSRGAH